MPAPSPFRGGPLQGLIEATSNFCAAPAEDCARVSLDSPRMAGPAASSEPKINNRGAALIGRSISSADFFPAWLTRRPPPNSAASGGQTVIASLRTLHAGPTFLRRCPMMAAMADRQPPHKLPRRAKNNRQACGSWPNAKFCDNANRARNRSPPSHRRDTKGTQDNSLGASERGQSVAGLPGKNMESWCGANGYERKN